MNYRVICESKDIKIDLDRSVPALTFLGGIDKHIYRVDDNIVEIIYLSQIKNNKETIFKNNNTVLLLKEINNENSDYIEEFCNKNNIIVATGKNSSNINIDKQIHINELYYDKEIHIGALIKILFSKDILFKINNTESESYMILGKVNKDNPIGNMSYNVLSNFSYVDKCDTYEMYIYSNEEFNLQDIAYVEDLIKEYIDDYSQLRIIFKDNVDEIDSVYYCVLAEKYSVN